MIFYAIDPARPGKDFSAEAEYRMLPDGTIQILQVRTWKHELDLTANPPRQKTWADLMCPTCGAAAGMTEKRPNGDTTCVNGHIHPASEF